LQIAPDVKQDQTAYVAEVGLELLEACLEREELPPSEAALQSARSLCDALSSPIVKWGDNETKERLRSAKRELETLEELAKAFRDLETNAKDPKANLVVGLHHAFVLE